MITSNKIVRFSFVLIINIFLLPRTSISQKINYDQRDGWKIENNFLLSSFIPELNRLRDAFDLTNVQLSDTCDHLADVQVGYVSSTGNFSHLADGVDFSDRVMQQFPTSRSEFAELLLKIPTDPPNKISLKVKKEIIDSLSSKHNMDFSWDLDQVNYSYLADRFLKNWLNSPPHREILLKNGWRNFGLKTKKSQDGRYLYATLVFSN